MNHELEELGNRNTRCTVCLVVWRDLTDRDRLMLTHAGKCIGQPERWRHCQINHGLLCLGVRPGHEACIERRPEWLPKTST